MEIEVSKDVGVKRVRIRSTKAGQPEAFTYLEQLLPALRYLHQASEAAREGPGSGADEP